MLIIHVIRDMQIPFEIKEIPELDSKKFDSFNDARGGNSGSGQAEGHDFVQCLAQGYQQCRD